MEAGFGPGRLERDSRNNYWGQGGYSSPLVSVIIVVYQDIEELKALVENVSPLRGENLELIVIDGGSRDGTIDYLLLNSGRTDYWLSENDMGIYDAMNKGVAAARGTYILHLNAGDRLLQLPTEILKQSSKEDIDVVSFQVLIDGKEIFTPRNGFKMRVANFWHHQGTFYSRLKHLGYDVTYKICGDFDHNQRLIKSGCQARLLPLIVAEHKNNGISMQSSAQREILRSVRAHFGVTYSFIAFIRININKLRKLVAK